MRICLIHNFYGSEAPSGENRVFELERRMLESRGHEVECFTRSSDEIRSRGAAGTLRGALSTPWNAWMASAVRKRVNVFKPEIVHVHNTFPLISPAIFYAIGNRAKKVLTLHNYRTVCPAAIPLRKGRVCTLCIEQRNVWPSVRFGCYRESRLATLPLAVSVALHRGLGTWGREVDRFIALSDFQREIMEKAGFPREKMCTKPNFFPGCPQVLEWTKRRDSVVFVGRLSVEKGLETLIEAWRLWGDSAPELRLIGDGPLRDRLVAAAKGSHVRFLGQLPSGDAHGEVAKSKMLLLPSQCYEAFPMVIPEAFAYGVPVGVSSLGPLPNIVDDGRTGVCYPACDAARLVEKVSQCWSHGTRLSEMGRAARNEFEQKYTEEVNYQRLLAIYGEALSGK